MELSSRGNCSRTRARVEGLLRLRIAGREDAASRSALAGPGVALGSSRASAPGGPSAPGRAPLSMPPVAPALLEDARPPGARPNPRWGTRMGRGSPPEESGWGVSHRSPAITQDHTPRHRRITHAGCPLMHSQRTGSVRAGAMEVGEGCPAHRAKPRFRQALALCTAARSPPDAVHGSGSHTGYTSSGLAPHAWSQERVARATTPTVGAGAQRRAAPPPLGWLSEARPGVCRDKRTL